MHSGGFLSPNNPAFPVSIGIASLVLEGRPTCENDFFPPTEQQLQQKKLQHQQQQQQHQNNNNNNHINNSNSTTATTYTDSSAFSPTIITHPTANRSLIKDAAQRINQKLQQIRSCPGTSKEVIETTVAVEAIPSSSRENGYVEMLMNNAPKQQSTTESLVTTVNKSLAKSFNPTKSLLKSVEAWTESHIIYSGLELNKFLNNGSPVKVGPMAAAAHAAAMAAATASSSSSSSSSSSAQSGAGGYGGSGLRKKSDVKQPHTGPKQGPHCEQFLRKIGLVKGDGGVAAVDEMEHSCNYLNEYCCRWQIHFRQLSAILSKNETICIEVYLGPENFAILLEQWIFRLTDKPSQSRMTLQSLCAAIRSQLYFSQITAWADSIKTSSNSKNVYDNPRIRRSSVTLKPKLDILFRIKPYDATSCFNTTPLVHNFPDAIVSESMAIQICLKSLPRMDTIPTLQNNFLSNNVVNVAIVDETGGGSSGCSGGGQEAEMSTMMMDDRLECHEKGKHVCTHHEEDEKASDDTADLVSSVVMLSHRERQLQKYKKRLMKRAKKKKAPDDQSSFSSSSSSSSSNTMKHYPHAQKCFLSPPLPPITTNVIESMMDSVTTADAPPACPQKSSIIYPMYAPTINSIQPPLYSINTMNGELFAPPPTSATQHHNQKPTAQTSNQPKGATTISLSPSLSINCNSNNNNNNNNNSNNNNKAMMMLTSSSVATQTDLLPTSLNFLHYCDFCGNQMQYVCWNCDTSNNNNNNITTDNNFNNNINKKVMRNGIDQQQHGESSCDEASGSKRCVETECGGLKSEAIALSEDGGVGKRCAIASRCGLEAAANKEVEKAELLLSAIQRTGLKSETTPTHNAAIVLPSTTKTTNNTTAVVAVTHRQNDAAGNSCNIKNNNNNNNNNNHSRRSDILMCEKSECDNFNNFLDVSDCRLCKRQKTKHHYDKIYKLNNNNNNDNIDEELLLSACYRRTMSETLVGANVEDGVEGCSTGSLKSNSAILALGDMKIYRRAYSEDVIDTIPTEGVQGCVFIDDDAADSLCDEAGEEVEERSDEENIIKFTCKCDNKVINTLKGRCKSPLLTPTNGCSGESQFKTPAQGSMQHFFAAKHMLTSTPSISPYLASQKLANDSKMNHPLFVSCKDDTDNNFTGSSKRIIPKVNLSNYFTQSSDDSGIIVDKDTNNSISSPIPIENVFNFDNLSPSLSSIPVQKSNSAPTFNYSPNSLSPRFYRTAAMYKRRSRHLSERSSERSSIGSDEQLSDEELNYLTNHSFSPGVSPIKSPYKGFGKPVNFGRLVLLGSLEESLLQRRFTPKAKVDGFKVLLGAAGNFCPTQLTIPAAAYFYELQGATTLSTPYVCELNLPRKGYSIPSKGTVQATLLNPLGTVVRMFVVPYDFRDMPAMSMTFIRQKILACDDSNTKVSEKTVANLSNVEQMKLLRYAIHLRFQTSASGRLYLHTDIKLLISRRTDCDTAAAHAKSSSLESANELQTLTIVPDHPKFSARTVKPKNLI